MQELQYAMRRAGQNPTDIEVQDLINKIDNGTGTMDFQVQFYTVFRSRSHSEPHHFLAETGAASKCINLLNIPLSLAKRKVVLNWVRSRSRINIFGQNVQKRRCSDGIRHLTGRFIAH
jgi:hypothetical protein